MSTVTLADLKTFLRETADDLDVALQQGLDAATSEAEHYIGLELGDFTQGVPSDVKMAVLLLAQVYCDAGNPNDNEHRRIAAHRLLTPYRINTGFGAAA